MKRSTKSYLSLSMALLMAANGLSATAAAVQMDDPAQLVSAKTKIDNITDFSDIALGGMEIDDAAQSITLANTDGDHFAMYNGLEKKAKDFTWEADVQLLSGTEDGKLSAALVFGASSKEIPGYGWYGANIDTSRENGQDLFRVFGPGMDDTNTDGGKWNDLDLNETLHLKLEMAADGTFTYSFGNTGKTAHQITRTIPSWSGGYVGLLTFCSEATFSNVSFEDNSVHVDPVYEDITLGDSYHTNLTDMQSTGGTWNVTEKGLYSNAVDKGDCFAFSEVEGSNFVYSTDVSFQSKKGAAALLFRSNNDLDNKEAYAVNLDVGSHKCKFWRWQEDQTLQLIDEKEITPTNDETYTLKVVSYDSWISYYVNNVLVASTGDYTLQKENKGQNTVITKGKFGLLNWNGEMTFDNTYYTALTDTFNPTLKDISVSSSTGSVEAKTQFTSTEPITLQYVGNDASTVDLTVKKTNENAVVRFYDADGTEYADGKNIPVAVGANYLTVTSTVAADNDVVATLTYRVNVHRRQTDETYYNEPYRGQYHYSVKDGWANDPNGMVYYNGTYHMFYQFYDDNRWGPMHWAHATSKDLIHWEEQPIALYPDANGAMFSGCIVADENNTSDLFKNGKGGLVALITADGNGQRIKLAYSTDEGKTWSKVDDIAADWTDDPLVARDFRDPKVFRWEGKWFMVVAGGPLRIYSSDNLKNWKCESAYPTLHTECPDLYPVQTEDGLKWVLSRGGRLYKIGDFKEVDGNWKFVPDTAYQDKDGVMNFGKDSYAAMTYYVQDFGTAANPMIPDIVELNWMNTWDYCKEVADDVGQEFNGTFNLNLKVGVTKDADGNYLLTQTPISAYESLRDTKNVVQYNNVEVSASNTLLKDFSGDTYEIVSKFYPADGTKKVGFSLRSNGSEQTKVIYDLETETLSIDRSQSGKLVKNNDSQDSNATGRFKAVDSQKFVTKNTDGSIDLHIYVDKASVEVFAKNNTVAGANQIFPSADSLGASVIVEGDAAKADITIYPMKSIWKNETSEPTKPTNPTTPTTPTEKKTVDQIFTDVLANEWYTADVQYVYDNGLMHGTSATTFEPNGIMTRAQVVQVLYNRANKPKVSGTQAFSDVTKDAWYYDAVQWAAETGVTEGVGEGKFAPDEVVTREQLAKFLYKDAGSPKVSGTLDFADANKTSEWAVNAMTWAVHADIVRGEQNGNTILLNPCGNATRAQCATMFKRYLTMK